MMGPILLGVVLCILGIGLFYALGGTSRGRNYPRGPDATPIFGNLFSLMFSPHKTIMEWTKQYGPIMAIEFGLIPAVVISDPALIRKAFDELEFLGRPVFQNHLDRCDGEISGVTFTNGKEWQDQKRFILRSLRDFGFGKKSMEEVIHEEVKDLIRKFRRVVGEPVSTKGRFDRAILTVLWHLIVGERFKKTDPEFEEAIKYFCSSAETCNRKTYFCIFIPVLLKILSRLSGYKKWLTHNFSVLDFLKRKIKEHIATSQDGHPRDFIDAYLEEIDRTTDPNSTFYKERGEKSLQLAMFDLMAAGGEPVSTTMSWACLYLAKYPKVQKKMQFEIQKVIGNDRLPSLKDKSQMPFTEAVIQEVLRLSSVTPFGVAHNTTKATVFEKYTIPKNTMIIANLYAVHYDEEIWGDSEYFRPQRFLNKRGELKKNENFMPFSVGKRGCLGETLAKDELFLFLTSLFQVFNVAPTTSEWDDLKMDHKFIYGSSLLAPMPHELIFTERN